MYARPIPRWKTLYPLRNKVGQDEMIVGRMKFPSVSAFVNPLLLDPFRALLFCNLLMEKLRGRDSKCARGQERGWKKDIWKVVSLLF